jgi:hypothetical protein
MFEEVMCNRLSRHLKINNTLVTEQSSFRKGTLLNLLSSSNEMFNSKLSTKEDRQCTHIRNNGARSRNHWCHWKPISIKYSEHASYPQLPIMQRACTMLYCYLWPVRLYNILAHCLIKGTKFEKPCRTRHLSWYSLLLFSETSAILK